MSETLLAFKIAFLCITMPVWGPFMVPYACYWLWTHGGPADKAGVIVGLFNACWMVSLGVAMLNGFNPLAFVAGMFK